MEKYSIEQLTKENYLDFCKGMNYKPEKSLPDLENSYTLIYEKKYIADIHIYNRKSDKPYLFIIINEAVKNIPFSKLKFEIAKHFKNVNNLEISMAGISFENLLLNDEIKVVNACYSSTITEQKCDEIIIEGSLIKYIVSYNCEINCDFNKQNITDSKIIDEFLKINSGKKIYFTTNYLKKYNDYNLVIITFKV